MALCSPRAGSELKNLTRQQCYGQDDLKLVRFSVTWQATNVNKSLRGRGPLQLDFTSELATNYNIIFRNFTADFVLGMFYGVVRKP